ncbi:Uncharacterised protein [Klebsiella pneumoniae]|nr:Uncharacterised protein [Klebsiella pneumoniae]
MVDTHQQQDPGDRYIEAGDRRRQHHQRRTRHPGDTFRGQHQGQHHDRNLAKAQRHVIGLGDKHRGEGAVDHRANEVERVANRQDERDDIARAAKLHQSLKGLRIGRFRAAGGKGHQHRIFQHVQQAENLFFQHHIADGNQHRAGQQHRQVVAADERSIVEQDPQPLGGNHRRDGGEDGQRRNVHHIARHLQHNVRHHVKGRHQRSIKLLPQRRAGDAEEHREHHDLQDLVVGHRLGDAGGDGVRQESFQAHAADRQAGIHRLFRHRQV